MSVWKKTFGGLNRAYYFRHFVFACVIAVVFIGIQMSSSATLVAKGVANPENASFFGANLFMYVMIAICAVLYPYAMFVYEGIVNFIMGDNVFFINAFVLLAWKFFVMLMMFAFSPIVAPVGLLYLYYHHTKNKTFENDEVIDKE